MKAEIISIGDELLIGQTVNTNATWIGQELSFRGYDVSHGVTIKDGREDILDALEQAQERANVVIVTGGLGPTKDDITKRVLCEYFDTQLELNQEVLDRVKSFFDQFGKEMLDVNVQQAYLPKDAITLRNDKGTASGMLFERKGVLTASLPGVPYEMKHIMLERLLPILEDRFEAKSMHYETIFLQGIGESYLAERIVDIENELREEGYGLAYLPKPGLVRLRLYCDKSEDRITRLSDFANQIYERLPQYAFTRQELGLSEVVGQLLVENKSTVGTVESCTGGRISREFVSVAGSSNYYKGSLITYTNELKNKMADVDLKHFDSVGAVSEEVVTEMAQNGRKKLEVDYCIATSGIAGPEGGTDEKPVGTVWIAVAGPDRVIAKKFLFGTDRLRNIEKTMLTALNLLRCEILKINIEKS